MSGIILSHSEDVDGIISIALALRAGRINECAPGAINFANYGDFEKKLDKIIKTEANWQQPKLLIICDLSISEKVAKKIASARNLFSEILIFDHHSETVKNEDFLRKNGICVLCYGYERKLCSSMQVFQDNINKDEESKLMARVAQKHDYPKTKDLQIISEAGIILQKIICWANLNNDMSVLKKLAINLNHGNISLTPWLEILSDYEKMEEEALEKFKNSIQEIKAGEHKFICAYADAILPKKEILRYLRDKFPNKKYLGYYTIFLHPSNSVLFFKNPNTNFDTSEFWPIWMEAEEMVMKDLTLQV